MSPRPLILLCLILLSSFSGAEAREGGAVSEFFRRYGVWRERSAWQEIIDKGKVALKSCKGQKRYEEEVIIRSRLATTYYYMGDYTQADRHAGICLAMSEKHDNPTGVVKALYLQSAVSRAKASESKCSSKQQRFFARAKELALKALKRYDEANLQVTCLRAKVLYHLASAYSDEVDSRDSRGPADRHHLDKAKLWFHEAMVLFNLGYYPDDYQRSAIRKGKVMLLLGEVGEAREVVEMLRDADQRDRTRYHWVFLKGEVEAAEGKPLKAMRTAAVAKDRAKQHGAKQDIHEFKRFITEMEKRVMAHPTTKETNGVT